jgi:type II secretory pathway component GspD/PulD (secretin)
MGMGLQRHLGRATGILMAGALGTSLLALSGPRARAGDDAAPGQKSGAAKNATVDVDIVGVRLQDALRMIESKTGINYVLINPALQYNNITLSLSGKPIDVVLRQLTIAAGADLWYETGIYYIGPKGSAPKQPEPLPPDLPVMPQPRRAKMIQKLSLLYSEPNAVLSQLGIHRGSALEDYLDVFRNNVLHMLVKQALPGDTGLQNGVTPPFTVITNPNTAPSVAPLVPTGVNRAENPQAQFPRSGGTFSLPQNGGDQVSHRDGQDGSGNLNQGTTVERAGQFPGGGGFQGGGGGGFPGQGGGGFPGQGGGGFPGGGAGQPPGGGGQAGGANLLAEFGITGQVLANPDDNSIILITDDPADFDKLKQLIRTIDVKPRQVMIRAEFVTVTSNGTNGFGINWTFQKVNLIGGANTGFSTTNTAFLQFATGNLQTELSFILTSGQGRLVAAPMATTLNNVPVTFTQTNTQAAFVSQPIVTPGGTTVISQTIVPIPVTQGLIVLPRINGDESLTLFGTAISTSLGAPITGPNGESFPNVTQQTAPIQRIIRNGDTMVISGLTSKNDILTENKVPLLGDLPLIGNLFRSRNTTTSDAELLVFITPTIIQERPSQAAIGGGVGGTLTAPGGPGGGGGGVIPGGGN